MGTQGLVTVRSGTKVVLKVVAGCNGQKAQKVAELLQKHWPVTPRQAYKLAVEAKFGDADCLVAMGEETFFFKGDVDLDPRYRETFQQPRFNPRWAQGTADHVVVISVP